MTKFRLIYYLTSTLIFIFLSFLFNIIPPKLGFNIVLPLYFLAIFLATTHVLQNKNSTNINLLIIIFIYFFMHAFFTFRIPNTNSIYAKGFICTKGAAIIFKETCPFVSLQELKTAEYEASKIWIEWTITANSLILNIIWLYGNLIIFRKLHSFTMKEISPIVSLNKQPISNKNYYFLSYSRKDIKFLDKLLKKTSSIDIKIWYDKEINLSNFWDEEISEKIRGSNGVILLLSNNFTSSKWVQREIRMADDLDKKIIVIQIENVNLITPLDLTISRRQIVNFEDPNLIDKIYKATRLN